MELAIFTPTTFLDRYTISASLRGGNPVFIDISKMEPREGNRIINFVCGTAFSINGHMFKSSENAFIVSPENIPLKQHEAWAN